MDKKTIAAIKRHRTRRLAALIAKSAYFYQKKQYDRMANMICNEFVDLGGVYIKFLQGILLRSEIMKRWDNPDRLKIFENLDHEPLNIAEFLQKELPKEKLEQIALVQPQPFAAGSFGQVYYATLKDNSVVVLKVLRPMIQELLAHDLKLLTMFYKRFFIKLYKNVDIDLSNAVEEFRTSTLRETDYVHEAEFANELYEAYKGHPKLFIPKTYLELCTDNLIVQEYVDGLSVAKLIKLKSQGVDPKAYVKETLGSDLDDQLIMLGYEAIMGVFKLPRVMGDPHPGNIRLMHDNRVGIIDFGISAKTPEDKSAFFGLIEAYDKINKGSMDVAGMFERSLHFFVGDLYQALNRIGQFIGEKTLKNVTKIAGEAFEQVVGTNMVSDSQSDASMLSMINKAVNKGNRFGLVMKLENSDILRATQTFSTMISYLGRDKQVTPVVLDRVVHDVSNIHPEYLAAHDNNTSIGDAIETIVNWLERVALRDPVLFQKLVNKVRSSTTPVVESNGEQNA